MLARPRNAVGSVSDSKARGPGFNTQSGHILSFLLLLFQEGQLLAKSMCTKYLGGLSLPKKSVVRLTDRPHITSAVY